MSLRNRMWLLHFKLVRDSDDDSFIKFSLRLSRKYGIEIHDSRRWCKTAVTGKVEM
jgi:hypothetical protein